jgi:glyoxylase-like metal-dependent hydrolase (beta-lactamase superfamily II)
MTNERRRRELARADRVVPGVWRLRLPLPWPAIPHVNAWAIASEGGVVLVDTGLHEPGGLRQLERALDQAGGLRLEDVRLLVCTHAHADHYGLAGPIVGRAGCELWMHPNHEHMTKAAASPEQMLERRIEVACQSGVPARALAGYEALRRERGIGVAEVVLPDRELVPGVEVQTDLGEWRVYETPGHAPSHVTLHQPERGLLLSGDHILGRVSLYYDFGYTPDPVGEFLDSLGVVENLGVELILAGHGRPVRDLRGLVAANRRTLAERLDRVRRAIADQPRTPYEIVPFLVGEEAPGEMMVSWGLSEVLCYLRHLEVRGEAAALDGEAPARWTVASRPA